MCQSCFKDGGVDLEPTFLLGLHNHLVIGDIYGELMLNASEIHSPRQKKKLRIGSSWSMAFFDQLIGDWYI